MKKILFIFFWWLILSKGNSQMIINAGGGGGTTYTADETTLHLAAGIFSIKSTYTGQSSIVTLGTIATGSWQGTAIGTAYGGVPSGGSSGFVLTKNSGTNYDYSWVTAGGLSAIADGTVLGNISGSSAAPIAIGAEVLLTSGTVTNQANGVISWASWASYREITVEVYDIIPATDNQELQMVTSNDGTTFATGAGSYWYSMMYTIITSDQTSGAATGFSFPRRVASAAAISLGTIWDNTSSNDNDITLKIKNPSNTGKNQRVQIRSSYINNTPDQADGAGSAVRLTNDPMEAARLAFVSGNISFGYIIKGVK